MEHSRIKEIIDNWRPAPCSTSNWTSVEDGLPIIPKDRYGIYVLIATYDKQYAECCNDPMKAWDVEEAQYGYIDDLEMFKGSKKKADFMCRWDNGQDRILGPVGDPVYFWQYMPEAPNMIPEY